MNRKALFLDLDGTLLNDKKEITPGSRAAIDEALAQGHQIIVTTGRPLSGTLFLVEALGLDKPGCYAIAFNGSILYDMGKKEIIFHSTMPLETVHAVFEEANRRGVHIQTYDEKDVVVEKRCAGETAETYCSRIHIKWHTVDDIHELEREPEKMLLIDYYNKKPLEDFCDWLRTSGPSGVDCYFSCDNYVEVVVAGMNKGDAVRRMASLIGIPIEDMLAAGDAANDLPMIQAAHIGIAMANGDPDVKAAADYVTERDNNHDGIEEVIRKFML